MVGVGSKQKVEGVQGLKRARNRDTSWVGVGPRYEIFHVSQPTWPIEHLGLGPGYRLQPRLDDAKPILEP